MAFTPNWLYFLICVFIVFSVYIITCCHFTTVHAHYLYMDKSHDSIVTHFIIFACLLVPFYIRFANTQLDENLCIYYKLCFTICLSVY